MHASTYKEMQRFIDGYLDRERKLSVLDVGSLDVNGTYRDLFTAPQWTYTGLDIVDGKNVDVVASEPYRYPFDAHSVDVIISGSALEHVEDTHAFVKEIARVMKPNGIVCIIAPWTWPEHKHPVDCWRIMPDGMRFLLGNVAGMNVLSVYRNDTDCVGIAGRLQRDVKLGFGVLVNDMGRLDMVFRQSKIDPEKHKAHIVMNPSSATHGLNKLLEKIEADGKDIAILAHQDMYFRNGWLTQVEEKLAGLPDSWVVAGIIGKDMNGEIMGRLHDMRLPLQFDYGPLPVAASCFDECCLFINLKKGFRFDEALTGFDLYGTLAVLQAWEMNGTAWIIDAFAEHYCMRGFTWAPSEAFAENFRWLHKRFPDAPRIDTTVIGTLRRENKARYD